MSFELSVESRLQSRNKQPLILAVDDDEDSLLLLTQALDLFGFSCVSTGKGRSAVGLAQEYQPDLILLDIVLRDLSGFDILQVLKQDAQTVEIPVIAVTALAMENHRRQIMSLGCDDYISKPYTLDVLETTIHQQLNRKFSWSC